MQTKSETPIGKGDEMKSETQLEGWQESLNEDWYAPILYYQVNWKPL